MHQALEAPRLMASRATEPLPAKTSTKGLSIRSNCRVLKRDSLRIALELRVVSTAGISTILPLCTPAMMGAA